MSDNQPTYFELLKQGKKKPDDIFEYYGYWHAGRGGNKTMCQYLGVTNEILNQAILSGNSSLWKYYNTERGRRVASEDSKLKS